MPFGEVVIGSPGSGKSTYAFGKQQLLTALKRPIAIVNLDPANDLVPYKCDVDIASLISLQDAMEEYGLGPNGGMLYCMEYLEANFDWLEEQLRSAGLLFGDSYVVFDVPGQVELSSDHHSLKNIIGKLEKLGFRLVAVHLCDAYYVTDAAKYISVLLLSLRTMLHMGLPHINVLSKIDLISRYGDLDFNLDFYTEVQDLSYLQNLLSASHPRFAALNEVICGLVEDFSLVSFETLAVEDKTSMLHLMRTVDRVLGYVFVQTSESNGENIQKGTLQSNQDALFSSAMGAIPDHNIQNIQERWIDNREEYDAWESREWRQEGMDAIERKSQK
ncbi:Cytoplasmic protein [Ceratobasidium theobromae]|uniref:GPN-loop GTPase 2 n=1 Tax=Ceratobasidium theobromae TaxID=1582974 RepID=A0A5N5QTH4_9AGAM|nr:Cytoplasmic protein [Ceratobasidium theobromae]